MENVDVQNLCRCCMESLSTCESEIHEKTVDMFIFCTNIKVEQDNLSRKFCSSCIKKIEYCYSFIQEARRVDVALKKNILALDTRDILKKLDSAKFEVHNFEQNTDDNDCKPDAVHHDYVEDLYTANEEMKSLAENVSNENKIFSMRNKDTRETKWKEKIICQKCHKEFMSSSWFVKHMKRCLINPDSTYRCTCCPRTFLKSSHLEAHSVCHSERRQFHCSTCGKEYKRQKQLKAHLRVHCDIRPHACDKCQMRFKLKSILKVHMRLHSAVKEYLCTECGATFHQGCNLQSHMRRHTGEKPYSCKQCTFRSSAAASLRRHERQHTNARTHVCVHCRKGFYEAGALNRHIRTHTGELPYKCPNCSRAFIDSWKRKRHMMHAHRLQLQDIPRMERDGNIVTE